MEYLQGLAVVLALVPFSIFILDIAKKYPQQALGMVSVMMVVDGVITVTYAVLAKPDQGVNMFVLGVLSAIMITMMFKIRSLMNQKK